MVELGVVNSEQPVTEIVSTFGEAGRENEEIKARCDAFKNPSSGNTPITFKVTKSTRSDQKRPEVRRSALLKAKCQLRESRRPLSAQIWRGKMIGKRLALKVENIFLMF